MSDQNKIEDFVVGTPGVVQGESPKTCEKTNEACDQNNCCQDQEETKDCCEGAVDTCERKPCCGGKPGEPC